MKREIDCKGSGGPCETRFEKLSASFSEAHKHMATDC